MRADTHDPAACGTSARYVMSLILAGPGLKEMRQNGRFTLVSLSGLSVAVRDVILRGP